MAPSPESQQSYANHVRKVPALYVTGAVLAGLALLGSIAELARHPSLAAAAGLAADLHCWLLRTDGMHAVLAAMDDQSGIVPAFYVCRSDVADADGKRVVQRVALALPRPEKTP